MAVREPFSSWEMVPAGCSKQSNGDGPHIFLFKQGDIKEDSPKTRPFHHSWKL